MVSELYENKWKEAMIELGENGEEKKHIEFLLKIFEVLYINFVIVSLALFHKLRLQLTSCFCCVLFSVCFYFLTALVHCTLCLHTT